MKPPAAASGGRSAYDLILPLPIEGQAFNGDPVSTALPKGEPRGGGIKLRTKLASPSGRGGLSEAKDGEGKRAIGDRPYDKNGALASFL